MPTITAYFTIDSEDTGAHESLAYRNDESDEVTSFPSGTRITSVNLTFNKGFKRNVSSGSGSHDFKVELEAGVGGTYYTVWDGSTTLSGTGGDGTCALGDLTISSSVGKTLASTGISDIKATSNEDTKLYAASGSTATAVFTYEYLPSITAFTSLSASAQTNAGKTTVSWSSCTGSNGSGSVTYELKKGSTSLYSGSGTSVTLNVGDIGYGTSTLTVYAYYSGETISRSTSVTFYVPSMSAPVLSISPSTGTSTTLSWTAATLSYTSGTIKYTIYKDGTELAASAISPYPLSQNVVSTWGDSPVTLTVKATATITGNTYSGSTMTADSNSVTFTYIVTITRCGAPTVVSVSDSLSYDAVSLKWSGATDGTDNAITGYNIKHCESEDGNTWGDWSDPVFAVSSPLSVTPPDTLGNYYKFCVQTCGSAGSEYYSEDWTESGTLQKYISPDLVNFTDPVLYAGTTKPKAVHMTELHNLINALMSFNKNDTVAFSDIVSMQTSLLDWKDHIAEIRDATDTLVQTHDDWLDIPTGLPSAAVITQIRDILTTYYNER